MKKQMIKRADGSYSQRGLWDNIRANRGSGKKPTAEMLKQERKIKAKMKDGGKFPDLTGDGQVTRADILKGRGVFGQGGVNNPGFKALPGYVQAKIKANMEEGGMMPQTSAGQAVVNSALMMSKMQNGAVVFNPISMSKDMEDSKGQDLKTAYYMKKGGQFPDRYKKMGFKGVDQPKRTPGGSKSHAVVTKVGGDYKLIRFGQQGVTGDRTATKRAASFKARHAKNIAKGKSSAAYWANKIKWILFIPLMLWQTL